MLPNEYFVGCFIYGLKEHIKVSLRSHNPAILVQAYALARNYENYSQRKQNTYYSRMGYKNSYQVKQMLNPVKKEDNDIKQPIVNKWEKGKCFKCQEPWVLGHTRVCKYRTQLHLIAVEEDLHSDIELEENMVADTTPIEDEGPKLQISMHAMLGTSSETKTFPMSVTIGNAKLVALIDSGNTTIFMDISVIVQTNLPVINHKIVKVIVANGNTL
jgi:hypothetical protein